MIPAILFCIPKIIIPVNRISYKPVIETYERNRKGFRHHVIILPVFLDLVIYLKESRQWNKAPLFQRLSPGCHSYRLTVFPYVAKPENS